MTMTQEEAKEILKDIKENDAEAYQLLRDKCNWERMGQLAVIECWGDPRKW